VIAGIVLAAGASRRLGRNKLLLPFRGGTVLSATVSRLLSSPLDRLVVVLGHEAEDVRAKAGLPADPKLELVLNPDWPEGMASSLRRGVTACADAEAVVIALGDQPDTDPDVVAELLGAFRAGAPLAFPIHPDPEGNGAPRSGHPVLFGRELFPELLALWGDRGARDVVARHFQSAGKVEAPSPRDIDTDDDYRALLAHDRP
jgi:CTP:molybdopterin cytidylyltransferase MocA